MKKIIASLALSAALAAGITGGARAQVLGGTGATPVSNIYTLTVTPTVTTVTPGALYTYSYSTTLTSNSSGTSVNVFNINNVLGYVTGSASATDGVRGLTPTGFSSSVPLVTTVGNVTTIQYTAGTGFKTAGTTPAGFPVETAANGDTSIFSFQSTLPPTGRVSLGSNGKNPTTPPADGNLAGTGGAIGPGLAVVPESSSFALLGLGLLPLGLLARRRIANKS